MSWKPESVVDAWFDEPQTVQHDIEEVVTYTLRIPHLTLASDAASESINDGMAQLQSALESYADDEVYKGCARRAGDGLCRRRLHNFDGRWQADSDLYALWSAMGWTARLRSRRNLHIRRRDRRAACGVSGFT